MNYNNNDIIIAQSTPIGSAALAIVRASGESLIKYINLIINQKKIKSRYNYTVQFKSFEEKQLIDTCVVTYYKGPSSFTGEDMLEIVCHGNDVIVERIINEFIKKGVRIAYPGEFSYRAFQNNKIDLMQAESIAEKITSNSGEYAMALQNIENGTVSRKLLALKNKVINTVSIIEHELDFNEEEITHLGLNKIKKDFNNIQKQLSEILLQSSIVKKTNQGYRVVILGLPNVGKSTLFNEILGVDRAIVTSLEGTTRDVLEAKVTIKNTPFTFYDTAGYRKTKNIVENLGIKKGVAILKDADVVLVLDEHNPKKIMNTLILEEILTADKQVVCVQTKCDTIKISTTTKNNTIKVSAHKKIGINRLLTHLLTVCGENIIKSTHNNLVVCNERQVVLMQEAKQTINTILGDLEQGCTMDIIASGCRDFINIIEDLLGKITSTDVLNNIFKGFCVGK